VVLAFEGHEHAFVASQSGIPRFALLGTEAK
jgi:hypothetical protein